MVSELFFKFLRILYKSPRISANPILSKQDDVNLVFHPLIVSDGLLIIIHLILTSNQFCYYIGA